MRKIGYIITLLVLFTLPLFLFAQQKETDWVNDEAYNKMKPAERTNYDNGRQADYDSFIERKAKAEDEAKSIMDGLGQLRDQKSAQDAEIQELYTKLGITEQMLSELRTKIQYFKDQLANWEKMTDDELWRNVKAYTETKEDYRNTTKNRLARLPEFSREFTDLNRRFTALDDNFNRIKKQYGYYEDDYVVQRGDTYSKISGYDFIYNDSSKNGIIYRANRDRVHGYNLVVGSTIKIPRGLPTSWKVFTGESLWKISQYPEVYGTGKKWPLIHRANRDKIKNPDLIFPNQVFTIPRDDM